MILNCQTRAGFMIDDYVTAWCQPCAVVLKIKNSCAAKKKKKKNVTHKLRAGLNDACGFILPDIYI